MARRTKEQKRRDDLVERLCNELLTGWEINVFNMHKLSDAGKAVSGSDDEVRAAIVAARDKYAKKVG